jgi:hypothetical protein
MLAVGIPSSAFPSTWSQHRERRAVRETRPCVKHRGFARAPGADGNIELTRVAVARCSSKAEAVQAAIKEFEKKRKGDRWDLVAHGYDVLERGPKPLQTERVRQRAHELWEQEGRPGGVRTSTGQGHAASFRWRNGELVHRRWRVRDC